MNETKIKNYNPATEKDLRISLTRPFFEKLNEIKEFYGIKNNTEIIRYLITIAHREIREHSVKLNNESKEKSIQKKKVKGR